MLTPEYQFTPYRRRLALPSGVSAILAMTDEAIAAWDASRVEVNEYNRVARQHNQKVEAAWLALLSSMGVQTKGTRGGTPAHVRQVMEEMRVKAGVNGFPDDALGLTYIKWPLPEGYADWAATSNRHSLREVIAYVRDVNAKAATQKMLADASTKHWLARGPEIGMHIASYPSVEAYIVAVRDADAKLYVASREGEVLHIGCCSECDEWTVGEHRCSCGNRRMSLDLDWNAREMKWEATPEAW